jgi:hypothetical protein
MKKKTGIARWPKSQPGMYCCRRPRIGKKSRSSGFFSIHSVL